MGVAHHTPALQRLPEVKCRLHVCPRGLATISAARTFKLFEKKFVRTLDSPMAFAFNRRRGRRRCTAWQRCARPPARSPRRLEALSSPRSRKCCSGKPRSSFIFCSYPSPEYRRSVRVPDNASQQPDTARTHQHQTPQRVLRSIGRVHTY